MAGMQVLLQRRWSQEKRLWGREPWSHGILVWPLRGSGTCGHMGSNCCLTREAIKNRILEAIWTRFGKSSVTCHHFCAHHASVPTEPRSSSFLSDLRLPPHWPGWSPGKPSNLCALVPCALGPCPQLSCPQGKVVTEV